MKKKILPKNKIKGKIQAWSIDESGEIESIFIKDHFSYKKNLSPNSFLSDLAGLCTGIANDIEIKYIALSTAYDPPSRTTTLEGEFARVEPLSVNQINNKIIVEGKFDSDSFTKSVNITAVSDKKTFTVSSASGFLVGDRIQIKIGNLWYQRKLVTISGNIFTISEDLPSLPTAGTNNCQQMISRLHLVYGTTATGTANSGKAMSLAQLIAYKPSTRTIYTRHEVEFLGS